MMKTLLIGLALLSTTLCGSAQENQNLKPFPHAAKGFNRVVISLPHKTRKEEQNFRVELIVGKVIKTDGVNHFGMNTSLEPKALKGWGFTYYNMKGNDLVRSTLMAARDSESKIEQFVGGKPLEIRYNSRIPIVIYTPEDFEVRYRIWTATSDFQKVGTKTTPEEN